MLYIKKKRKKKQCVTILHDETHTYSIDTEIKKNTFFEFWVTSTSESNLDKQNI